MKKRNFIDCLRVPCDVMKLAVVGDLEAMEIVTQRYDSYIKWLSVKYIEDERGKKYPVVDAALYSRLKRKLIVTVMNFDFDRKNPLYYS